MNSRTLDIAIMTCAQRRPEITPGYEQSARKMARMLLSAHAQRRPEITPGYEVVAEGAEVVVVV